MNPTVQLNVRMSRELRDAGNAALEGRGISPSAFVREVWRRLAQRGEQLESMLDATYGVGHDSADGISSRENPIARGQALYARLLDDLGLGDVTKERAIDSRPYDVILEDSLIERWEEKGLLHE